MTKRLIIHVVFALPLVLLGWASMAPPEDAGTPYLAMLRSGLRQVATEQEVHYANNDRYATTLDELRAEGWEGFAPSTRGEGAYSLETASDSTGFAVQGSYSGMPDVICYSASGDEVSALPPPAWWNTTAESRPEQCTPGAPIEVPGSVEGGALAYLSWISVVFVGLLSLVLVVAQLVAEMMARSERTEAAAKAFLKGMGPARAWSVLWVLGYLLSVTVVPW